MTNIATRGIALATPPVTHPPTTEGGRAWQRHNQRAGGALDERRGNLPRRLIPHDADHLRSQDTSLAVNAVACGALLVALSFPRGNVHDRYGSWQPFIV